MKAKPIIFKYYVYRHIRLDKNEPFYIGVGTENKHQGYHRAYTTQKRNNLWNKIASKTGIRIEILFEGNDYQEVLKKELEFIRLYGRINNNTGILANLTDGGEKNTGAIPTAKARENMSISHIGQIPSELTKEKRRASMLKTCAERGISPLAINIYQYTAEGLFLRKWESAQHAERFYKKINGKIRSAINKENHYAHRFMWFNEYMGDKIEPSNVSKVRAKIEMIDMSGNVTTFANITEASLKLVGSRGIVNQIIQVCKGKKPSYKNNIFRHAEAILY